MPDTVPSRFFEADAQNAGYAMVVANTDYRPQQLAAATQWMLGHRLAVLALWSRNESPRSSRSWRARIYPSRVYDVGSPGPNVTNVKADYYRGMQSRRVRPRARP